MIRIPLVTSSTNITLQQFWNAVLLHFKRPHLTNRRLLAVSTVLFLKVNFNERSIKRLSDLFTRPALLYEIRKLMPVSKEKLTKEFVQSVLTIHDKELKLKDVSIEDFMKLSEEEEVFVSVRLLLPRNNRFDCTVEVVTLDKKNCVASFFAVTEFDRKPLAPPFSYDIEYQKHEQCLRICLQDFSDAETASSEWLADELFPKLMKWAESDGSICEMQQSLSLIPTEKYTELYLKLKNKYGSKMVEEWPEHTDPLKFVYEDVAIVAYLITLWNEVSPGKKPSFVDLGCGNGLLVYILNEEGFPGYGIDVRKRKIWDMYPKSTVLKVETITPSASSLFPEIDWVIGNHSDELTPWIPVIAARSSCKTNFFLLPCCCYEFNGLKYRRQNSAVSVYAEYLLYIQDVAKRCGFATKLDKLRIPSTKRTCILSWGRLHGEDVTKEVDGDIVKLIEESCGGATVAQSSDKVMWTTNFQARSNHERVRNCTQLDKSLIRSILLKITSLLLAKTDLLSKADGSLWNRGGAVCFSELVTRIDKEHLKGLKSECGGLQTLLRNHRYIFEIDKGMIRLRVPPTTHDVETKYKNKPCWFFNNHPNGCVHDVLVCAYKH